MILQLNSVILMLHCLKNKLKITIASFPGNINIPLTTFPGGYEYSLDLVTGTGYIHEPIPLKLGYKVYYIHSL